MTEPTPTIRINSDIDLIQAVPVLLGYVPTESMVLIAFSPASHRVELAARFDLPTSPAEAADYRAQALAMHQRVGGRLAVVAFSLDLEAGRTAVRDLLGALPTEQVVTAALAAVNGWTWIDPKQPDAIQWTNPYPTGATDVHRQIVEAGRGEALTRTYADLQDEFGPHPTDTSPELWAELYQAATTAAHGDNSETSEQLQTRWGREIADWLSTHETTNPAELADRLTVEDAAWLAARITSSTGRTAALACLTADQAEAHLQLWQRIADHAGQSIAAIPALILAGVAAWIARNSTTGTNILHGRAENLPNATQLTGFIELTRELTQRNPQHWEPLRSRLYDEIFPPF